MKLFTTIILVFLLIGCSKEKEISSFFNCKNNNINEKSTLTTDFKKHFRLNLPSSWNTKLYYSDYQSEIFAADTTKQLTDSFIIDTAFNTGKLNIDDSFIKKNDSLFNSNNLEIIKSSKGEFQSMPSCWYLVKGTKNNFEFHQLILWVNLSKKEYFSCYIDIYGNENIEERICKVVAIIEDVEFL